MFRRPSSGSSGYSSASTVSRSASSSSRRVVRHRSWQRTIVERFSPRILRHIAADSLVGRRPQFARRDRATCARGWTTSTLPGITAAVCTRNGADRIAECLDALAALEYPSALSRPRRRRQRSRERSDTGELVARYPSIRYVVEPRPGLDWARNRAIVEARGEIVAFTDDDVSVDPGWAAAIGRSVRRRIRRSRPSPASSSPDEIDVESQRLFEQYGGFGRGFDREYFRVDTASGEKAARRHAGAGRFGAGANMAFRRSVFEQDRDVRPGPRRRYADQRRR